MMEYKDLVNNFKSIKELIDLEKEIIRKLNSEQNLRYRQVIHKNMIIEIYTFWENFVKNLIYNTYIDYKKYIVNEEFVKKYLKFINENSHIRKLFIKNIKHDSLNITLETLCHSNNLNDKVLKELFIRITFDIQDLNKHIIGASKLNIAVENLKTSSIKIERRNEEDEENVSTLLNESLEDDISSKRLLDAVYNYIYSMVQLRNNVSHNFRVDEIYKLEDWEKLADFIFEVCFVLIEFCKSQTIKKIISTEKHVLKRMYPKKVFMHSAKGECVLGITNLSGRIVKLESPLYIYSPSSDLYKIAIIKGLQINKDNLIEALPFQQVGIKLETNAKIKPEHTTFYLYSFVKEKEEFNYALTI